MGLEAAFRFGNFTRPLLDSDFRRNDEVVQSTPLTSKGSGIPFASMRNDSVDEVGCVIAKWCGGS